MTPESEDTAAVDLVANASVFIRAPRRVVWRTLLAPETIPAMMPVTEVVAPWQHGEPFAWSFKLADFESRIEGCVLAMEAERLLEYEYIDPHSRDVLGIDDNVHHVTIALSDEADGTRVVIAQDANISATAHAHAEGGWRLALNNLKALAERAAASS